jgi:histidinol-phosphate aminotransferase
VAALHQGRRAVAATTPAQEAAPPRLDAVDELPRRPKEYCASMAAQGSVLPSRGYEPLGPAVGNFLFVDVGTNAAELDDALLRRGVIVRPMGSFGASTALRITAGTLDEIAFLEQALEDVFSNS